MNISVGKFYSNKKQIIKNALIYVISTFVNKVVPFFVLMLLTKYLTSEEFGIASMITSTCQILTPFIMMGASAAFIRKFAEPHVEEHRVYLFNGLCVMGVMSLVVTLFVIIFIDQFVKYTAVPGNLMTCLMIIAISNVFYDTGLSVIAIKEKAKVYFYSQLFFSIFNAVLAFISVIVLKLGLTGYIFSLALSGLAKFIVSIKLMVCEIGVCCKLSPVYLKDIVCLFGLPMIPTQLKGTILTYSDRLFITNMVTITSTGVYSLSCTLAQPIEVLCQSFNLAFVPWLYKKLNKGDEREKRNIVIFTYIYGMFFLLIAFAWNVAATVAFNGILDNAYAEGYKYLVWITFGYAFHAMQMMVVNYIYYTKKVSMYSVVTLVVIALNVVLNIIFIKHNGTEGAAQATFLVNIISFILTWSLASYVYKMPWFTFFYVDRHQ